MGIVRGILKTEQRSSLSNPEKWLSDWFSGGSTSGSGIVVSEDKAMAYSAFYACVKVIAETIASLPLPVYERLERGKRKAQDHPLYPLLHDIANPEMTAFQFRETLQAHALTWGNGFAQKVYSNGWVKELWPLRPDRMTIRRVNKMLVYEYRGDEGSPLKLESKDVFHLPGLGFDGLQGYSPIAKAREAIGLGLAAEQFGGRFFANDARPGVILRHPGHLSDEAFERIKKSWEDTHKGSDRAHKAALLEEGMDVTTIGIPPEDAQFLGIRKFQVSEIARMFRIPPHMIGDLEHATFSNIEHQAIEFVVHCIRPWLVRWEQQMMLRLFEAKDRAKYFPEFAVEGLLRGDIQTRYQAFSTARQNGWMSANDVRELENQNPIEGGDEYWTPLNMISSGSSAEDIRTARKLMLLESRNTRASGALRKRLRDSYLGLYVDAAKRILWRERSDVLKEAARLSNTELMEWLDGYYRDTSYITKQLGPVNDSYAEAVYAAASDEIGANRAARQMGPEYQDFTASYSATAGDRYAIESRLKLQKRVREAEGDSLEDLEDEFDEWETRPENVARCETVRLAEGIAALVFINAGFGLVWVAGANACPYCAAMDGMRIEGGEDFASEGDELDQGDHKMSVSSNVSHPPLHDGCECGVTPG